MPQLNEMSWLTMAEKTLMFILVMLTFVNMVMCFKKIYKYDYPLKFLSVIL